MTESSTYDSVKLTSKTLRSRGSSTPADQEPAEVDLTPEPEAAPEQCFPGFLRKLGGFVDTLAAIETKRKSLKLPSLTPTDYRFVPGCPGGNPFSFPVTVIYKPESPQEKNLGTFRIGR
jgi:hypothetical protein